MLVTTAAVHSAANQLILNVQPHGTHFACRGRPQKPWPRRGHALWPLCARAQQRGQSRSLRPAEHASGASKTEDSGHMTGTTVVRMRRMPFIAYVCS